MPAKPAGSRLRGPRQHVDQFPGFGGEKGRALGTEPPSQGTRDKDGLESLEHFLSSPVKTKRPAFVDEDEEEDENEQDESEDEEDGGEESDQGSSIGPEKFLGKGPRRPPSMSSATSKRLPPTSSPLRKTNIGGSPRRPSSRPASTPSRGPPTPNADSSQPNVSRRLNFSAHRNAQLTATESRLINGDNKRHSRVSSRDQYSLSRSPEQPHTTNGQTQSNADRLTGEIEDVPYGIDGDSYDGGVDDVPVEIEDQAALDETLNDIGNDAAMEQDPPPVIERRGRGRPPKKPKPATTASNAKVNGSVTGTNGNPNDRKNRGRPPKDIATKITSRTQDRDPEPSGMDIAGHNRYRQRNQTPLDPEVARTRLGRVSYKPLQWWKGEKVAVLVSRDKESNAVMESVQEIIRMDDLPPVKRQRSASAAPPRRKRRKRAPIYQSDEEDEEDPDAGPDEWEVQDGVIAGPVRTWDEEQNSSVDEQRQAELAFASYHIETREVRGADFRFAKTLTLPFFGTGIVEIPPRGSKKLKNSRKMQMVFFMHYGKVIVEVSGNKFTITKGGVWQVPRGNFYSIRNDTDHPAKLFFAQGCEVIAGLGTNGTPGTATRTTTINS